MIASGNSRKDSQKLKYEGADANCYTYMEKGYQTPYEKKRTASGQDLFRQAERDWKREMGRAREGQWDMQVIRSGKEAPAGSHNLGIKTVSAWGQEDTYGEKRSNQMDHNTTSEIERRRRDLQSRRTYQRRTPGAMGQAGYASSAVGRRTAGQRASQTFAGENRQVRGTSMSYAQNGSGRGQAMPKYVMGAAVPKEDYEYEVAPSTRPEPTRRKIEKPKFEPQEIQRTQPATRRQIGKIELPDSPPVARTGITLKRARKTIALVVAAIGILSFVVMRYSAIGKNNLAILDVKENINEIERNVEDLDLAVAMKDNLEDIQTVASEQLHMSKPQSSQMVYVNVEKKEKQETTQEETTQEEGFNLGKFFSDLFSFLE